MKVFLIDESLDRVGGVEHVICTLANMLINKYEVEVISEFKTKKTPFYKYNDKIKINYLINEENSKTIQMKNKSWLYYFMRLFEKIKKKTLINNKINEILKKINKDDTIVFGRVFTALDFLPIIKKKNIKAKIIVRDAIHLEYYSRKVRKDIVFFVIL